MTTRDYQLMVHALAEAHRRRDTDLTGAERAYQESSAQAAGELARAEGEAHSADRWAGAAAAQVLEVDQEATRLWDSLRKAHGVRAARALGELPEPTPMEALPRVALPRPVPEAETMSVLRDSPKTILARAASVIDHNARPVSRARLPRRLLPFLPLVGAAVATLTALLAAGLVTIGGTPMIGAPVLRAMGWITFLIAPSSGVAVAAVFANRRLQARLDVAGVGLTLLGGMTAAALMSVAFSAAR